MGNQPSSADDRERRVLEIVRSYGRVAVAFSGGVDSAVVAMAAKLACGDDAIAVTAVSDSLAEGELKSAVDLAVRIGIRHRVVQTDEFQDGNYSANPTNRCYFCKTELYSQIERLIPELGVDVIVNGANLDDLGDFRPGLQAAREHSVRSPLAEAGLTKRDVRDLAKRWELPVWDKPAAPCLASRIAYGVEVTPDRVARVDAAERFLREELGLRELRVRLENNDLARIEVPGAEIARLTDPEVRRRICERFHSLGFKYVTVDLDGFRSGSMNAVISTETLLQTDFSELR